MNIDTRGYGYLRGGASIKKQANLNQHYSDVEYLRQHYKFTVILLLRKEMSEIYGGYQTYN